MQLTVSNDGHVPDVGRTVHQGPDLIDGEVDHFGGVDDEIALEAVRIGNICFAEAVILAPAVKGWPDKEEDLISDCALRSEGERNLFSFFLSLAPAQEGWRGDARLEKRWAVKD